MVHPAQKISVSGLDTSAGRAGAGFPGFQKLENEMRVFMQDDEGDFPLGVSLSLRQGSEPSQVQPDVGRALAVQTDRSTRPMKLLNKVADAARRQAAQALGVQQAVGQRCRGRDELVGHSRLPDELRQRQKPHVRSPFS